MTKHGRSGADAPSGHSPKGGAASSTASPAKPSVPNAALGQLIALCELRGSDDETELLDEAFRLCFPKPKRIWVTDNRGEWTPEYAEYQGRGWRFNELMESGGWIDAARELLAPHTLWCVGSMEEGPFARIVWPQPDGGYSGGYYESTAPTAALALCAAALKARRAASGIETEGHDRADGRGAEHESPAPKGDAQC
jgi:hypothetical protein